MQNDFFWKKLEKLLFSLYPEGPKNDSIWERSGGDLSDINIDGRGKVIWYRAITYLRKGGKNINLRKLLGEIYEDFPNNSDLINILKKVDTSNEKAEYVEFNLTLNTNFDAKAKHGIDEILKIIIEITDDFSFDVKKVVNDSVIIYLSATRDAYLRLYSLYVNQKLSKYLGCDVARLELLEEEIDLKKEKEKERLRIILKDEKAVQIALESGSYWEFELAAYLLELELEKVNEESRKFKSGLTFRKSRHLGVQDYLNFNRGQLTDIQNIINMFKVAFEKELIVAFGEPGVAGDEFKIKNAIDKIAEICHLFLEWELSLYFTYPPDNLTEIKELMSGWTEQIIGEIHIFLEKLKQVYLEKLTFVEIGLKLKLPPNSQKLIEVMKFYKENPRLLKE